MADEIVFYTNPMSRGRIVRWMLEEVGHPYRTEIIAYDAIKAPGYLAVNPMGKVPALMHGDACVTETAAICAYLADAFPQAGLAPACGSARRGPYYRWLFFGAGPFEAAVTNKAMGFEVPEARRVSVGYGELGVVLDTLEAVCARGEYLLGAEFSAVDVYLGSQIGFGLMFKTIEARPAFVAYWDRVKDRPAAVRAREVDDALMPRR